MIKSEAGVVAPAGCGTCLFNCLYIYIIAEVVNIASISRCQKYKVPAFFVAGKEGKDGIKTTKSRSLRYYQNYRLGAVVTYGFKQTSQADYGRTIAR